MFFTYVAKGCIEFVLPGCPLSMLAVEQVVEVFNGDSFACYKELCSVCRDVWCLGPVRSIHAMVIYFFVISIAVELSIEWQFIIVKIVLLMALPVWEDNGTCHSLDHFNNSIYKVPIRF
jgi:hypothetical protein